MRHPASTIKRTAGREAMPCSMQRASRADPMMMVLDRVILMRCSRPQHERSARHVLRLRSMRERLRVEAKDIDRPSLLQGMMQELLPT